MAHIAQERYSTLVDEKLRNTLVTKDNLIFKETLNKSTVEKANR